MPQMLLELFSEEIPARMQAKAERDLEKALMDGLTAAGFLPEGVKAFSTPRRLAAVVEGLPGRQPDVREERKGPRVGAPEKAIEGFLRGAGLASIDQARVQNDPKGDFYVAVIEKAGRETAEVIAGLIPQIVREFSWPKSMRTGSGDMRWVRPLQRIVCAFDGEAVPLDLEGVACGRTTSGHRFHAPAPFDVRRFDDYQAALRNAHVVLDREERKRMIAQDAKTICEAQNLELVEDPGLLEEVAGLVEWPVVLLGEMDPAFLDLPGEVIRLTMRTHQKYFAVRDPKTKKLAPKFVIIANVEAKDGGAAIAAGNARVLSARLNDARFFWDIDRKKGLEDKERLAKLDQIVFHAKLGSVGERAQRIARLLDDLRRYVAFDFTTANRAARLCKADLVSETVGEFPELQGQIGGYLAQAAEDSSVAVAIEDHYRPLGPNDRLPSNDIAAVLALADKLDLLVGFFSIGETPTGAGDPYSLRRAALGVIRIVRECGYRIPLREVFPGALQLYRNQRGQVFGARQSTDLLAFIADRLKVQLRDQGKRHDLVDAVFALGDDDLVRIVARVEALDAFLKTEDGKNLLAGAKRAANILAAEEKKGAGVQSDWTFDEKRLEDGEEKALHGALERALPQAKDAVEREDFAAAMKALSGLRAPVDAFFDKVLVNAKDESLRRNRLLLLKQFADGLSAVADFSKIEG
jgi:glycyl-tRNA synthetase beta chain